METLFENKYIRDKEVFKELYRYCYFQRKSLIVCYVILILSFLANIALAILGAGFNVGIFIFVPLLFLFQFFLYYRRVNMAVKRDEELELTSAIQVIVTEEYAQIIAPNGSMNKLYFDKIKFFTQTKNLILLCSKANLLCILHKESFTKGDGESFVSFIAKKGIKMR